MTDGERPRAVIEPFDPDRHDRRVFSSGVAAVDNFLQRSAGKQARAGHVRLFVLPDAAGRVIGYHALNAHGVSYTDLPPRLARDRPRHGTIPAAYLAMLGVDRRHTGRGLGGALLVDALCRVAWAAEQVGMAVVLLDVLDCGDPVLVRRRLALYQRYGFQPLPGRPQRLFLPVGTIAQLLGADASEVDPVAVSPSASRSLQVERLRAHREKS